MLVLGDSLVFVVFDLVESLSDVLDGSLGVVSSSEDFGVEPGIGHSDPQVVLEALFFQLIQEIKALIEDALVKVDLG